MNNKFPAFAPIAAVVVIAAIASAVIVSQSRSNDNVAVVPAKTETVAAGTVSVISEDSQSAAVAQSAVVGQAKRINWNTTDYPSATVNISIIRKTSDSPASYQSIRVLSNVANSGSTLWTPTVAEVGNNIFVEVGCTSTAKACKANISPVSYTVTK